MWSILYMKYGPWSFKSLFYFGNSFQNISFELIIIFMTFFSKNLTFHQYFILSSIELFNLNYSTFHNLDFIISLLKALMSGTHKTPLTQGEAITDGIDISSWTVKHNEYQLTYSAWDFAGQTVYYNTHQVA